MTVKYQALSVSCGFASTVGAVCDRAIASIRADRAVIDRPYNASSLTVALLDYPYGEIPYPMR